MDVHFSGMLQRMSTVASSGVQSFDPTRCGQTRTRVRKARVGSGRRGARLHLHFHDARRQQQLQHPGQDRVLDLSVPGVRASPLRVRMLGGWTARHATVRRRITSYHVVQHEIRDGICKKEWMPRKCIGLEDEVYVQRIKILGEWCAEKYNEQPV